MKLLLLMPLCLLSLCAVSCKSGSSGEMVIFAAASLTETMEETAGLYAQAVPNVKIIFNFDSSGTLKTQIEEGAECDIFISAGQIQMDQLDGAALIQKGTRFDLLENRIALCVPKGNPAGIKSFAGLADTLAHNDMLLAMGNGDVPAGQYAHKILSFFNLDEQYLAKNGRITYGSNVREVAAHIAEASVSYGIVYATDARVTELEIVDYASPEMCGQVLYPAAVLKNSRHSDLAQAFMEFLKTDQAMAVFENAGFSVPGVL